MLGYFEPVLINSTLVLTLIWELVLARDLDNMRSHYKPLNCFALKTSEDTRWPG